MTSSSFAASRSLPGATACSWPNREKSDGTYQDIAHPINHETRKHLEDTVLAAYEAALAAERSRTESGILA